MKLLIKTGGNNPKTQPSMITKMQFIFFIEYSLWQIIAEIIPTMNAM